jgi:aspartate aminotransferase, mitochondrial
VGQFVERSLEFAYGIQSEAIQSKRIAAVQSISGTGGCRLAGEFVHKFFGKRKIYIPNPTWGNHVAIFTNSGLEPTYYRYFNKNTNSIDFQALKEDIVAADQGSVFMLHACAHNPTGCDPTAAQWDELSALFKQKGHMLFFDNAYQVCNSICIFKFKESV